MCMSCGCMNADVQKDDQITLEDLQRAAAAQGIPLDQVVANINRTYEQSAST